MNILDHFDENPLPWYDRGVQIIQNIPLLYRIVGIVLTIYVFLYVNDVNNVTLVSVGLLGVLSVLAAIVDFFFIFIGYLLEKTTSKSNTIGKLDYTNVLLLTTVLTLFILTILEAFY